MKLTINQALQQGVDAHKAGKFKDAEKIYLAILEIQPINLAAHNNLGVMFYNLGRFDEAESCYRKLIALKPNHLEAHSNLSVILQVLNKLEESEKFCKKTIELKPDYSVAHNNLSNTLKKLRKFDEAEKSYKTAIKLKPDYVEAHYNLGVMFQELDRLEESEASCKKVIELKPDYAETYNNLGITLQKLGRLQEAEKSYKTAIKLKPDYIEAHYNLSQIKNFDREDEQIFQIQNLYLNQSLTSEQHSRLGFALGKAFEDLNILDKSFKYYYEGNSFHRKSITYNINQDIEIFKKLKKSYSSIKKISLASFNLKNKPKLIFILGMPRSGTTLIEQIISAHSEVQGAGELPYIEQFGDNVARGITKINSKVLLDFRERYLQKLLNLSGGRPTVTDKMTINFRYVGLICSAFPEAKIVHVKRNPAATCWGNYKQLFSNKKSFHYCYNLNDIKNYYELYQDLMKFWDRECGDRIYNLNYETLTINQEDETRKLINYLGLNWENECLSPEYNDRIVGTASSKQIRKKIYQGSSNKWKKFEQFLEGIFSHFDN